MPLKYLDDAGYRLGMIRDEPSWMLPPGSVYDAQNVLFDSRGIARQRLGNRNIFSGAQTAYSSMIVFCYQTDSALLESLMAFDERSGNIYFVNMTTGVPVNLATVSGQDATRSMTHFGFGFFPQISGQGAPYSVTAVAGQQTTGSFTQTVNANMTAGSQTVTLTAPDATTNVKVGAIYSASNATQQYTGRVTAITNATQFTVWPPAVATAAFTSGFTTPALQGSAIAGCATSFQNRALFGNVRDIQSGAYVGRRIYYSPLPTEQLNITNVFGNVQLGANFVDYYMYPILNYIEAPGSDPIIALQPVDDNELLILTKTGGAIFRGNLITQLATTNPQITFDITPLDGRTGCIADVGVQKTNKGIVWAGVEGIYLYAGNGKVIDLTKDKINGYWKALLGDGPSVIGSAYARGTYVVWIIPGGAGQVTGIAVDLRGSEPLFSRFIGGDVFHTQTRPSRPEQVYGIRWWATGSAPPSMTNGQLVRCDAMFDPYTAGATNTDSDGTAIAVSLTTRALAADSATQKIWQRGAVQYQQSSTTAAMTVTARAAVDAADAAVTAVTLGTLSNTNVLTVTAATNATPIVCTTATHGLQTDDFVDITGGLVNTHVNGRWRITVLSSTTFSLNGSTGNGAYTASSANAKKVTESDFLMTTLNRSQGVALTVAGSPNNFQLHGVRLAYNEGRQVMSA